MPINTADANTQYNLAARNAAWTAARKLYTQDQISSGQADAFLNKYQSDPGALIADGYMQPDEYQAIASASEQESQRLTDPASPTIYTNQETGERTVTSPGVTIDQGAYATSQAQQNANAWNVDRMQQIDARDPNRFYADRASIQDVNAQGAQFQAPSSTATVTQGRNYFDSTGKALTGADLALAQARDYTTANGGKSADQYDASGYLKGAAAGLAPSAAESTVRQSGNEQQRAWQQQQLAANAATRRGSNDIRTSQMSQAAAARGNVSGLAGLRAANNTALGQAQLYQASLDDTARRAIEINAARNATNNQASLVRAQEMATARGQYADNAAAVRGQNLQQASQLGSLAQQSAGLAGQQYQIDQSVLQNSQNNAAITNQANQYAASGNYAAAAANADRDLAAQQANQGRDWNVAQANQQASLQAQSLDDTAYGNTNSAVTDAANLEQSARIKLEQDYQNAAQQNAALTNNFKAGQASLVQQAAQFEAERGDKIVGTAIGTAGTVLGAAIGASDERVKNVGARRNPADFRGATDRSWQYKPGTAVPNRIPGKNHVGPMAQQLPRDVRTTGPGGVQLVDISKLALRLASAVGDLQRKQGRPQGGR